MMPCVSLSPLKGMGSADLSLEYQRIVGYPEISTPSTSFKVPSKSASTMFGLVLRAVAASTKLGAMDLQWPHQGAQILTRNSRSSPNTMFLQVLPTRVYTASSFGWGTGADLSSLVTSPLSTLLRKDWMPSAVSASVERNLFLASLRSTTLGVCATSRPRYSANRLK